MKQPAVYIMANQRNGTLYTGVTSDLPQRAYQHRESLISGFTVRYGCKLLVWYEVFDEMLPAIAREKHIKGGSRKKKVALIETLNPGWRDLYEDIVRAAFATQAVIARNNATKQSMLLADWIASLRSQ